MAVGCEMSHNEEWVLSLWSSLNSMGGGGRWVGGFPHWHGMGMCAYLLRCFFSKFGIAISGFSSETKEPKLHKLGVFEEIFVKSTQIWQMLFYQIWYTDWWVIQRKFGVKKVKFLRSCRHIHVRFWQKYHPHTHSPVKSMVWSPSSW